MARLTKSFVTLADLYVAYKKAKVEAYYENTHPHALEFTAYEQKLHGNLCSLHEHLWLRMQQAVVDYELRHAA